MKIILGFIICAIILAGLTSIGCDSKGALLQERLTRTEQQLEEVRTNLEKAGKEADRIPGLLAKGKQYQEEIDKLKADISGTDQEKKELAKKNKQLQDENAKLKESNKALKEENTDLKRRIRELESAIKSTFK